MRLFPDDQTLAARWFGAIEVGCGYPVQSVNDIQPEICSSHFLVSDAGSYEEPSIFVYRYKISRKISSCRACLAFYPSEEMLTLESRIGEKNITALLESMDMCISKHHFLQLICLPCVAQLDMLTSLRMKFTQSELNFQHLIETSQNFNNETETCLTQADSRQREIIIEVETLELVDKQENRSEENTPKAQQSHSSSCSKRVEPPKQESSSKSQTNNNDKQKKNCSISLTSVNQKLERYCYICSTFLTDCSQLMVHLTETHTSETGYRCEDCSLDIHLLTAYNSHLSRHDESERSIKCSICSVRFVSDLQVKVHENKLHGAHHDVNHYLQNKRRFTVCDQCGDVYDKRKIKKHMEQVHQIDCQPKCNICNKTFTAKGSLERHMLSHTDAKPYVCEQCGASFRRLLFYRHHKSMVHDGVIPHVCSVCNEVFKTYRQLYNHRQTVHCNKPSLYQRYKQPEVCKLCSSRFPKGSQLMEHIKNVHADEQYPTLQCPNSLFIRTNMPV
ncbi:zinc finger protein 616-like [Sabethes cyaneus]|uniref:zinc finger protein 616-like n=1 Tax=Sabethes cyaneus TaxID=53552 RepID=UPI00237D594E|nr:zinc finger protein 616-like [Sabethes cyaneus]